MRKRKKGSGNEGERKKYGKEKLKEKARHQNSIGSLETHLCLRNTHSIISDPNHLVTICSPSTASGLRPEEVSSPTETAPPTPLPSLQ